MATTQVHRLESLNPESGKQTVLRLFLDKEDPFFSFLELRASEESPIVSVVSDDNAHHKDGLRVLWSHPLFETALENPRVQSILSLAVLVVALAVALGEPSSVGLAIPFYVVFFTMVAVIASRVEISFLLGQLLRSFDFVYLAYWSIVFFVATTIEGLGDYETIGVDLGLSEHNYQLKFVTMACFTFVLFFTILLFDAMPHVGRKVKIAALLLCIANAVRLWIDERIVNQNRLRPAEFCLTDSIRSCIDSARITTMALEAISVWLLHFLYVLCLSVYRGSTARFLIIKSKMRLETLQIDHEVLAAALRTNRGSNLSQAVLTAAKSSDIASSTKSGPSQHSETPAAAKSLRTMLQYHPAGTRRFNFTTPIPETDVDAIEIEMPQTLIVESQSLCLAPDPCSPLESNIISDHISIDTLGDNINPHPISIVEPPITETTIVSALVGGKDVSLDNQPLDGLSDTVRAIVRAKIASRVKSTTLSPSASSVSSSTDGHVHPTSSVDEHPDEGFGFGRFSTLLHSDQSTLAFHSCFDLEFSKAVSYARPMLGVRMFHMWTESYRLHILFGLLLLICVGQNMISFTISIPLEIICYISVILLVALALSMYDRHMVAMLFHEFEYCFVFFLVAMFQIASITQGIASYRAMALYNHVSEATQLADIVLWQTAWSMGSIGCLSFDACMGPRKLKMTFLVAWSLNALWSFYRNLIIFPDQLLPSGLPWLTPVSLCFHKECIDTQLLRLEALSTIGIFSFKYFCQMLLRPHVLNLLRCPVAYSNDGGVFNVPSLTSSVETRPTIHAIPNTTVHAVPSIRILISNTSMSIDSAGCPHGVVPLTDSPPILVVSVTETLPRADLTEADTSLVLIVKETATTTDMVNPPLISLDAQELCVVSQPIVQKDSIIALQRVPIVPDALILQVSPGDPPVIIKTMGP